jgi:alpha-glucosidase (family GH31 glycosyl hydrolase)
LRRAARDDKRGPTAIARARSPRVAGRRSAIVAAMRATVLGLVVAGWLTGCGSAAPPTVITRGPLRVLVFADPPAIQIGHADPAAADGLTDIAWETLPGGGVAKGAAPSRFAATRTATATSQMLLGSFKIEDATTTDAPWTGVDHLGAVAIDATGAAITFELRGGGKALGTGSVGFADEPAHTAAGDPTHVAIGLHFTGTNRASLAARCGADEHFLGLGAQSWDVDHRGQTVPLWVQEDGIGKTDGPDDDFGGIWFLSGRRHSTHAPMPMLVSSAGYALIVNTDARALFALCSEDPTAARYESWTPDLDLHLFLAGSAAAAVDKLTGFVGRPELPPAAVFAPWLDAIYGSANVRAVAAAARAAGIAASVIWSEDWRGGKDMGTGYTLEEDWHYDPVLYADFPQLAADLHGLGFDFLTYNNTFVDSTADVYAEATTAGHTIHKDGAPYTFMGVKFNDTTMLDLSNPAAVTWAKGVYREGLTAGADGWMADYGEWLPTDAVLASGEDALAVHNRYPRDWAQLNHDLADERRASGQDFLYFMRSAWRGSQPLVQVFWPGDQQTDWSLGDGFPSVIPMAIGLGLTGFPYFGSDIGGYMSQTTVPTTKELWFRWVELGALSPVMRTHHGRSARDNWNWQKDAESTAHFRRWSRFHMQLVPYLESLARDAHDRGLPLIRPIALTYDEPWAWSITDEYLLGDILVAPVIVEGATDRAVHLPAGTWYPLAGGAAVTGAITAAAPVTEIPAYVPAGALILAWPDGVDTVRPAPAATGAVTAMDLGGDRELWLWPAADGAARDRCEVDGTTCYQWTPRPISAGAATAATWNGAPAPVTAGPGYVEIAVVGTGTLTLAGGGTVAATSGAADRHLMIRIYAP